MEQFLLNLGKLSLLGSLIIVLLLLFRPLLGKRYRAKMFYILWLCLAVMLLLPFDYSVKNAPMQMEKPADYTVLVNEGRATVIETENLFAESTTVSGETQGVQSEEYPIASKPVRSFSVTAILFYAYLAGAVAFIGAVSVRYARFRRMLRRWKKDCTSGSCLQILDEVAESIGVKKPCLALCEALPTPMLAGVLHPVLLLPHDRYSETELIFIFRHELSHLKHRDMVYKLALLAANAVHWFNPLVYLMLRAADEDIELSADSAATCDMERAEKVAYSEVLLSATQNRMRSVPVTTCFGGTVDRLKHRIANVLGRDKRRGIGVIVLIVVIALALGTAVSWDENVSSADTFVTDKTGQSEETATNESTEEETTSDAMEWIVERGEFKGIFGLSGYIETETQEYGFSICRYYTDGGVLLAESYGYENGDYSVDFDRDGVCELVCNLTSGGDGHEDVVIYRLKNGVIEWGYLNIEKLDLTDYFNWGVNSTACRYDAQKNEFVLSYTSAEDNAKSNVKICSYEDFTFSRWQESTYRTSAPEESTSGSSIPDSIENALDYGEYQWFVAEGYFSRYADGKNVEQLYKLPLADNDTTPVPASVSVFDGKIALTYHVGGATMGHNVMRLFDDATGEQTHEINGYGIVTISGETIVKTTGFNPPAPDNLRISRDGGTTWDTLGDPKYIYGMSVTVNGDAVSYKEEPEAMMLTEEYLYITGVDTSLWDSGSEETLETLNLCISLENGETVIRNE